MPRSVFRLPLGEVFLHSLAGQHQLRSGEKAVLRSLRARGGPTLVAAEALTARSSVRTRACLADGSGEQSSACLTAGYCLREVLRGRDADEMVFIDPS